MKRTIVMVAMMLLCIMGTVRADIINGGFESGLEGWTSNVENGICETSVVSSYSGEHYSFAPLDGDSMLQIYLVNPIGTTYQDLFLNEGDTIQGYAGLDTVYSGMNYSIIFGQVSVLDQDGTLVSTLWENEGGLSSDWTLWSWNATLSGNYRLEFSFEPFPSGFSGHIGYAFFDAIEVIEADSATPAVPEPGTMILIGTGLIGIVGFRRRLIR